VYLCLTIILVVIGIFLHEYGHLYAMHQHGIKVSELCIGVPIPKLTVQFRSKFCFGTLVRFSPVLLVGYVYPESKEEYDQLDFRPNLEISAAGIITSLAYGALTFAVACLIRNNLLQFAGFLLTAIVMMALRKILSIYLLPIISLTAFGLVPSFLTYVFRTIPDAGRETADILAKLNVASFDKAFVWAAIFSIALALLNLIPLMPLDGGKLISACIKKWLSPMLASYYTLLTALVTLILVLVNLYDLILGVIRAAIRLF